MAAQKKKKRQMETSPERPEQNEDATDCNSNLFLSYTENISGTHKAELFLLFVCWMCSRLEGSSIKEIRQHKNVQGRTKMYKDIRPDQRVLRRTNAYQDVTKRTIPSKFHLFSLDELSR